ncbi:MAG: hypothetical protein ACOYJA_08335 [Christensenellales bacterium]
MADQKKRKPEDTLPRFGRACVLEDGKICNECGECLLCDLDHTKICDNCGKCIDSEADFRAIAIDHIDDPDDELDQAPESWYGPDDPFTGYDEDQEEE